MKNISRENKEYLMVLATGLTLIVGGLIVPAPLSYIFFGTAIYAFVMLASVMIVTSVRSKKNN